MNELTCNGRFPAGSSSAGPDRGIRAPGGPRCGMRRRHHSHRGWVPVQPGVLGEHGGFQPPQLRPGLQAELGGQHGAAPLVGAQRVGLPAAAVGRNDQLPPAPLPQRARRHHRLQLGRRLSVPAQGQPRLDPVLGGQVVGLGEPGHGGHGPRLGGELGQRVTPPQRQRLRQASGRGRGLAAGQVAVGLPRQRLEPQRVHLVVLDAKRIPGSLDDQHPAGARAGRPGSSSRRSWET